MPSPLDPALDLFLVHIRVVKGLAPNSVDAYACDLRRYLDDLTRQGLTDWTDIRREHLLAHLDHLLHQGISARSQARALSAIRSLHRLLLSEKLADADPTEEVDGPRAGRHLLSAAGRSAARPVRGGRPVQGALRAPAGLHRPGAAPGA